ncbi:MAG: membrane dipeptidase, partial [Planctomycetes bacterium]|nr:membrane dipeptidase [Planctomycetota bacterium]
MRMTDNHRSNRADHLHKSAIVIDTHCDTTQRLEQSGWDISKRQADGHLDLPRLREGGVSAVFFAVWAAGPLASGEGARSARAQIKRIHKMVETHPDPLTAA